VKVEAALRECRGCGALVEQPASSGTTYCEGCGAEVRFTLFPALFRARGPVSAGQAISREDESPCYFHEGKLAAAACDSCGRFLCDLCRVEWGSRTLCPACINAAEKNSELLTRSRTLYDSIALAIAGFSFLLFTLSLLTAPIAIVFGVVALRKPGSLVRRNKLRAWIAIALAVVLIGLWTWLFAYIVLRSKA
jgi:hypothetical protein